MCIELIILTVSPRPILKIAVRGDSSINLKVSPEIWSIPFLRVEYHLQSIHMPLHLLIDNIKEIAKNYTSVLLYQREYNHTPFHQKNNWGLSILPSYAKLFYMIHQYNMMSARADAIHRATCDTRSYSSGTAAELYATVHSCFCCASRKL